MHYAVVIPLETKESALKVLTVVLDSGLYAIIEERPDIKENGGQNGS